MHKRIPIAPALEPRLVENLDGETSWCAEVERPRPMEFVGWPHVEAVGLQPLVELGTKKGQAPLLISNINKDAYPLSCLGVDEPTARARKYGRSSLT
jgi:hypothetical protein